MTQHCAITYYSIAWNRILCCARIGVWYSFITALPQKGRIFIKTDDFFSVNSNMEMVGIYPAAFKKTERKGSCRSIKDNMTAFSKY